jgi:hypothetical protein
MSVKFAAKVLLQTAKSRQRMKKNVKKVIFMPKLLRNSKKSSNFAAENV